MTVIKHPNAQCRRLVEAVRKLSTILDRPVCTKDLREHFQRFPDERPGLWQTLGRQLFKTSRTHLTVDRVYGVGIIGNRAFYAADASPTWPGKLQRYCADLQLAVALEQPYPSAVRALFGGPMDALARNACAGWCLEMEAALQLATDPRLTTEVNCMSVALAQTKTLSLSPFLHKPLSDLMSRSEAIDFLTQEISRRAAYRLEAGINWNRILAGQSWPQSALFEEIPGQKVYSRRQLGALARSLWPEPGENLALGPAELSALRFGLTN
jgi:hypothetical protein